MDIANADCARVAKLACGSRCFRLLSARDRGFLFVLSDRKDAPFSPSEQVRLARVLARLKRLEASRG